jgi:heme/copper-type cytochrome/quinol oxidase subunit 2
MHGMMAGMGLGMLSGLLVATLWTVPTGDFLWGVIFGSVAGLALGMPAGRLGGHLGVLEGIMAGPMGGMMGAMLGQMIRPFNLEVFMPFFAFIMLVSLTGITYALHCGVSCCMPGGKKRKPSPVPNTFIAIWTAAFVVALAFAVLLSFPLADSVSAPAPDSQQVKLPGYLQQLAQETRAEAVLENGVQRVAMKMTNSQYVPNVIVARKGIPLKIEITADETAGCARDLIFPEFGVRKIVPFGEPATVEFTPQSAGEFRFHCSMDMARGRLIVTA